MLNNITLSRYINNNSIINKINSFGKLLSLILILIISIKSSNLYIHGVLLIYIFIMILLTNIGLKKYLISIRHISYLMIGIFIINVIFKVDIITNIVNVLRVIEIVLYTSIITITTSESELIYSLDLLFTPLKIFKINTNKISFILTLAIRFIPNIIDQINIILKSLLSRGIDFKTNKHKILLIKSIIIPTFNLSIKKADDLADSLELRSYDVFKKRTNLRYNKWNNFNTLIIIVLLLILSLEVLLWDI